MQDTCTLECLDKCQKAVYPSSVLLPESLSSCLPCPFGAFTVSPEFRPFTVMENQSIPPLLLNFIRCWYLIDSYFTKNVGFCQWILGKSYLTQLTKLGNDFRNHKLPNLRYKSFKLLFTTSLLISLLKKGRPTIR